MKFDDICKFVLQEANVDYDLLTGEEKPFYITPDGYERMKLLKIDDIENIVKKVAATAKGVGITTDFIQGVFSTMKEAENLSIEENGKLKYFTPTEIRALFTDALRSQYSIEGRASRDTDKATRAADKIFTWLKKEKYIKALTSKEQKQMEEEFAKRSEKDEIKALSRLGHDFEKEHEDKIKVKMILKRHGLEDENEDDILTTGDVESLGGKIERPEDFGEDESVYGSYGD